MSNTPASEPDRSLTMADAVRQVLATALERDESVVVLGETVGRMGGMAGETAGLRERFGERVRDLPIADRGTVGMAVGMALGGKRPVVSLSGPGRIPSVIGPLADAGRIATQGEFGTPLVIRIPYGPEAPEEQPLSTLLAALPGVTVVCPSDAGMAAGLLRHALAQPGPTVILEPRGRMLARGRVGDEAVAPRARVLRPGAHVTVAAWGGGVQVALDAADALQAEAISAEVVDLVALSPIDRATLGSCVRATGRLVVVHQGDPGWASQVRQHGLDEAFLYLEAPMAEVLSRSEQVTAAARSAVTY